MAKILKSKMKNVENIRNVYHEQSVVGVPKIQKRF